MSIRSVTAVVATALLVVMALSCGDSEDIPATQAAFMATGQIEEGVQGA